MRANTEWDLGLAAKGGIGSIRRCFIGGKILTRGPRELETWRLLDCSGLHNAAFDRVTLRVNQYRSDR